MFKENRNLLIFFIQSGVRNYLIKGRVIVGSAEDYSCCVYPHG